MFDILTIKHRWVNGIPSCYITNLIIELHPFLTQFFQR